jgi:hypothetical protein
VIGVAFVGGETTGDAGAGDVDQFGDVGGRHEPRSEAGITRSDGLDIPCLVFPL